jgi:PAS domain S-box-containing protein
MSLHEYFRKAGAPEGAPALEAHRRALAGESCSYEQLFAGRTYQSHVEPLREPDGHIIGVVGIALDITERKRAEEALEVRVRQRTDEIAAANEALRREIEERKAVEDELRQNQQRYASILNSQQTLISRSDPEGRITYVNAAHQRAFGSKVGDSVLAKVHPEDVEATRRAIEDLTRPPYTFTLEQRCEVRGQWRTFLWQGGVIRDRGGKVVEYQGVGFDITERKRAEEMLHESMRRHRVAAEQARDSAEDARRAAEEAGQVAEFNRRLALEVDHRVRNNLAGLLSLVGVMKERSKDVRSFATAIEGRLLAMHHVHQVLADTDFKAVDLKQLVASLLAAVEKLATFPVRVRVDGPSVPVPPRQTLPLSMILVEWFSNSCKYGAHTAHGGRLKVSWEVVTRATEEKPAVSHVRLRWQEFGGPQILGPVTPSLGTDLVRGFASRELAGRCELCYPLSGVDHMLEFPVE